MPGSCSGSSGSCSPGDRGRALGCWPRLASRAGSSRSCRWPLRPSSSATRSGRWTWPRIQSGSFLRISPTARRSATARPGTTSSSAGRGRRPGITERSTPSDCIPCGSSSSSGPMPWGRSPADGRRISALIMEKSGPTRSTPASCRSPSPRRHGSRPQPACQFAKPGAWRPRSRSWPAWGGSGSWGSCGMRLRS